MLVATKDMSEVKKLKFQLSKEFEMKNLEVANKNFGMEIIRDSKKKKLWLSKRSYIEKVLARFNMENVKSVATPLASQFRLSALLSPNTDAKRNYMCLVPYVSEVESIMYAMVCTRLDLSHAVGVVSKYMANLGNEH